MSLSHFSRQLKLDVLRLQCMHDVTSNFLFSEHEHQGNPFYGLAVLNFKSYTTLPTN